MSDQEMEQVRATARKIAERVKSDPAFKQQVQQDPKGALTAAGLPEKHVGDFLAETQLADVAGYAAKPNTMWCIALTVSL